MTISGYEVRNTTHLNHWNQLLPEWVRCFERMCDFTKTTPNWNSKEDSNNGPFSGAAWRLGWVAFPEIKCPRSSLGGYGEVDFYLACPDLNISEYIECKGSKIATPSHASTCLSKAQKHASTIADDSVPLHIGLGFCNVEFRAKENEVTGLTENLLKDILQGIECDAVAWCFPKSVRKYAEDGFYNPGVILLSQIAKAPQM